jgi:phosphoribosyl-ATP pyrophosphohydrolase
MVNAEILTRLAQTLEQRKAADPASSYAARLLQGSVDGICKKIGEEAVETVMAAKDGDRLHLVREVADLWFHSMLLLAHMGLGPDDVLAELARREGISGIDEKNARGS